jgi:hypothetical protein
MISKAITSCPASWIAAQRERVYRLSRYDRPIHKTHSITSRYVHSADAVLLAAADVVANATLMALDQAQPQLREQRQDGSVVWDGFTSL